MPDGSAAPGSGRDAILQRIILQAPARVAALYWRREPAAASLRLDGGDTLDLDTYFNSFDEMFWREHCAIGELAVQLDIEGDAAVELWRATPDGRRELVAESRSGGEGATTLRLTVPPLAHPRGAGRLALQVTAHGPEVRIGGGAWRATGPTRPVSLVIVICTHDRPRSLAALLARIAGDPEAVASLRAIVVVNNGAALPDDIAPPGLAGVLHIVRQRNSGGAGGFSRGLLESKAIAGATHAVLMDDDVEIEPDILARTAAIFAHARRTFLLGGHMLDLFRPTFLYEAGATIDEDRLALRPILPNLDLAESASLDAFLDKPPMHYCGWWYLGLELALLDTAGWPMPCFIRGDDVEWGLRLTQAGIDTVSLPGIGIWHEPFTAKLGSWHLYYEVRNMMALACWHRPVRPAQLADLILRWLVSDLLCFRYQRAAMILRAVEDVLKGPSILEEDPLAIHASLQELRATHAQARVPRSRPLRTRPAEDGPRHRIGLLLGVAWALGTEWFRPDRDRARARRLLPRDHVWFRVRGIDAVAVAEPWETENLFYARSRSTFRSLALAGLRLARRMRRELPAVASLWRAELPRMTTEAAWRVRLGVPLASEPGASHALDRAGEATNGTLVR